MKAVLCTKFGPPTELVHDDIPTPTVGPNAVLVDVTAAGLNFPDVLMVQGKYQSKPPFPFVPGAEVAGVVTARGESVTSIAVGERVMGLCTLGGFAEAVAVPETSVFRVPAGMALDEAAAFPLTYGTTYHALVDRGHVAPGETLLVTGAGGGVGLAAVQIGVALGARVIAAAGSAEKLEAARAAGASETIDYTTGPLLERLKALTNDAGADVIYEAVGGDVFDACVRGLAWGGRLLVIGFASGRIPEIPANRLLLKSSSAVGVFWGAFAARFPDRNRKNFDALFALVEAGKLKPHIGARYPLAQVSRAMEDMSNRTIVGKAVIEMDA